MQTANIEQIKTAVLAYRDGVLESSEQVLTRHDAEQIQTALVLSGLTASIKHILANAKPLGVVPTRPVDQNEKFLVQKFKVQGVYPRTYSVYILQPGDCFQRFGGSSSGLVVRKTPSLIVRDESVMGCVDTEHDIHDKKAWKSIMYAFRSAKKVL